MNNEKTLKRKTLTMTKRLGTMTTTTN